MIGLFLLAGGTAMLWLASPVLGKVVAVGLALYLGHCIIKPRALCGHCGGSGKRGLIRGRRSFRNCWACEGKGKRIRWGARIWPKWRDRPRRDKSTTLHSSLDL